jgi:hypothetical protein
MQLFRAEKIAEAVPNTFAGPCRFCNQQVELVHTVVDSETARLIRMFECKCGERSWAYSTSPTGAFVKPHGLFD